MKEIVIRSLPERIRKVRSLIESVGNRIGSVHFIKRSDGKKRRMSYRLHVRKPSYARKPEGKRFLKTWTKDSDNLQLTVFDVNKVLYNKNGKMNGRGDWRSIPLENVTRVAVNGEIYRIKS
jgi:hypothetical protein